MQLLLKRAMRVASFVGLGAFVFFSGLFGQQSTESAAADRTPFSLFSVPLSTPGAHADDTTQPGCPCSDGGCCE